MLAVALTPVWLTLVVLFSAGIQGFTGFGFGVVGMTFATFLLGPRDANLIFTLLPLLLVFSMWAWLWRHTSWRLLLWLLAGAAVGTPAGVWLLATAQQAVLRRVVGSAILLFAGYSLLDPGLARRRVSAAWGVPAGAVSGFFSGSASVGGPAAVVFLLISGLDKNRIKATLAGYFGLNLVWKLALVGRWQGLLTPWHLRTSAWLALPLVGGMALGMYGSRFVPSDRMRQLMWAFLLVPAAVLILG